MLTIVLLFTAQLGFSQNFVNLNFENASFQSDPSSGFYPYLVYASNAIPGWTAYANGLPQTEILSNNISLSGGAVSIIGTNWTHPQIEGKYFIILMGFNYPGFEYGVSIGQTGTIPLTAQSLIFWGNVGANNVLFDGQTLSTIVTGGTPNYNIYEADISAFAGQTGQLLFTTPPGGSGIVDNIQFSSSPVPEPSELVLAALGSLLLGFRRWKLFLHTISSLLKNDFLFETF